MVSDVLMAIRDSPISITSGAAGAGLLLAAFFYRDLSRGQLLSTVLTRITGIELGDEFQAAVILSEAHYPNRF